MQQEVKEHKKVIQRFINIKRRELSSMSKERPIIIKDGYIFLIIDILWRSLNKEYLLE
jgi:hypothetical protein